MQIALLTRKVVVGVPAVVVGVAIAVPSTFGWEPFARPSADPVGTAPRPAAPAQQAVAPEAARRAPLFGGEALRLPSLPFFRKSDPKAPANNTAARANGAVPTPGLQTASRFGGAPGMAQPYGELPRPSGRMGYVPPAVASHSNPQISQPISHGDAARLARYTEEAGIEVEPRLATGPQQIATDQPRIAAAKAEAASTDLPESPGGDLIVQAHKWSGTAQSAADYTRILEACRQVQASRPGPQIEKYAAELTSWALNRRGQLKSEAGEKEEALGDFEAAIQADPTRWRAIHNRGVLLAEQGDYERAFDDFSRTIQLQPGFAKAYTNRAALLVMAGELEAALQDYRQSLKLDSSLAVAHRGAGRVCHLLGRLEASIGCYDEAVRLTPKDAYTTACRADLLTDLGRYADAAAAYGRAIELDPESAHAFSSSAWLLATCPDASVRDAELAIRRANMAIELTGQQDAVSFDTLAAAHANAGDFTAATQSARQAVLLASPEERPVYEQRLVMYQQSMPYRIAPVGQIRQAKFEK